MKSRRLKSLSKNSLLLWVLSHRFWHILTVGIIFFAPQFYLMWTLPAQIDLTCVEQGYLTFWNIGYAVFLSFVLGILAWELCVLFTRCHKIETVAGISGVFAFVFALTANFCLPCFIPVLTIFGLNLSVASIALFGFKFKIISVILTMLSLGMNEYRYMNGCRIRKSS